MNLPYKRKEGKRTKGERQKKQTELEFLESSEISQRVT